MIMSFLHGSIMHHDPPFHLNQPKLIEKIAQIFSNMKLYQTKAKLKHLKI